MTWLAAELGQLYPGFRISRVTLDVLAKRQDLCSLAKILIRAQFQLRPLAEHADMRKVNHPHAPAQHQHHDSKCKAEGETNRDAGHHMLPNREICASSANFTC